MTENTTIESACAVRLQKLAERGCRFLGVRYPLLGGGMAWVSEHHLVSAISNAGGLGVLASGSMQPEHLQTEIEKTRAMTQASFGVNIIVMHPQIDALIDVCLQNAVSHIILAGGVPSVDLIQHAKKNHAKVFCFAPSLALAKRLIRNGADALILEGTEAGGHIGPTSTTVLAQEILLHIDECPVFIAGGIGRGEMMLAYLEMGAAGCQLGTAFVCCTESQVHPSFKTAFMRARARDAVASVQIDARFPVIPVRSLQNTAMRDFHSLQKEVIKSFDKGELTLKEAQLKIEHFWAGALRRAVVDGDIENGSLMAGQSVGLVEKEQSTAATIEGLMEQALQALAKRETRLATL
ncbi:MAG: nitronate monooxygenase [Holosporales bacterium]|jgi:enoyl-[acyl-carrier protein] reductase II|nr:nitronate monooxygenase [Holosporales bacterium]